MAVKEAVKEMVEEKMPLTTAITSIDGGALAAIDEDFGEYEGAGFEDVNSDEMAIPFVIVLQSNSPQVKKGPLHVEGAEEGMFYNQATGALYDGEKGVPFIPVDRDHRYVEFFPREDDGTGGGFVGVRQTDDELVVKLRDEQGQFGKLQYEDGVEGEPTELTETFSLVGWIVPGWDVSSATRATVPFASTKIQGYKKFISSSVDIKYWSERLQRYIRPPMFAHRYILKTVYKQKGSNSWYVIDVSMAEKPKEKSFIPATHPLRKLGEELHKAFNSGTARVAYEKMEAETSERIGDEPF